MYNKVTPQDQELARVQNEEETKENASFKPGDKVAVVDEADLHFGKTGIVKEESGGHVYVTLGQDEKNTMFFPNQLGKSTKI